MKEEESNRKRWAALTDSFNHKKEKEQWGGDNGDHFFLEHSILQKAEAETGAERHLLTCTARVAMVPSYWPAVSPVQPRGQQ